MPEVRKTSNSTRKFIINLAFFLLSIVFVSAIWPADKKETLAELLGSVIIISSCYLMLYLFLTHFRAEILEVTRKTLFIILIVILFIVLTRIVLSFTDPEILFLIPFAIIPDCNLYIL